MPRISLFNISFGFMVLCLAACAGAFVSFDMTEAFLHDPSQVESWRLTLMRSAHGHTNLFAIIQICLGLTLPYSRLNSRIKILQSAGITAGIFAMGPLMMIRAMSAPSASFETLGLIIGFLLSLALISIGSHSIALYQRFFSR